MTALFPDPMEQDLREQRTGYLARYDGHGFHRDDVVMHECQRCKAWVADRDGHTAWHRSVDTDQTTRPA